MVTETSAKGDVGGARALARGVAWPPSACCGAGLPVLGYTWFPLFTMIDWSYRFGPAAVGRYRLDLGLYTLDGAQRWRATPLVEQFRSYISDSEAAIGNIGIEQSLSA